MIKHLIALYYCLNTPQISFEISNKFWGFPDGTVAKKLPAHAGDVRDFSSILGWEDPLEEEMAAYSGIPACEIPWTEDPGRLQSMGPQRVGHD